MTEEKNPENSENIVKKVFGRPDSAHDRVSPIFTFYKNQRKAKKESKPEKIAKAEAPKRLPAVVDLGLSCIKVMQLAHDSHGGVEVVLMDEENCVSESVHDQAFQTKKALGKIMSRNSFGSNVIVGLQAKETQSYSFSFPPMSEEELREAVRWKIRQLKPFNLEEDQVHYSILHWDKMKAPGLQQRVTVVCVSTDSLSQKSAILNEVGLKPLSIHVSALELAHVRRFRTELKAPEEVVLWLDLGGEESVFIVEKNGVIFFMRNLTVTGNLLTKQVAQACHVTEEEAESLKQKHGLEYWTPELQSTVMSESEKAANPAAAVCYALISTLENLVVDIEYSFKYFSYQVTQSQVSKFDRVVLAGGCSNLKRIENFLNDRLAVPVEKVEPFAAIHVPESLKKRRKNFSKDGPVFAPAMGLAISPLLDKASVVDLLTGQKKKNTMPAWVEGVSVGPRSVGVLALISVIFAFAPQTAHLVYIKKQAQDSGRRVKAAREELSRRQSSQLKLAELEKTILEKKTALQDRLTLLQESGGDHQSFSKVLMTLASLMPADVWVTKLAFTENKLTLVGATSKNESIILFLENLKKPQEFSDVAFDYTQRDPSSSVFSFQIMMNVR